MASNGLAVAYRKYSTAYVTEEDAAGSRSIGIWSGKFDMPWDWRKAH
jgi:endonuclease YncB( thermonuclease family)